MKTPKKGEPKKAHHGMVGKTNASKGREDWVRTNVRLDPGLGARLKARGIRLTDFVDKALRNFFSSPGNE